MMKVKSDFPLIFWIAILLPPSLSLIIFCVRFWNYKFSTLIGDWGDAAVWFGLPISISMSILIAILTWKIHKNEEKRESEGQQFLESLEQPLCVFTSRDKENGLDKWWVENVGRGAALNLHIGFFETGKDSWENTLVNAYSLEANGKLELKWLHKTQCNKLVVFYWGVTSRHLYCTIGEGDNSFLIKNNAIVGDSVKTLDNQGMFFKTIDELLRFKNVERKQQAIERVYPSRN